MKGDRFNMKRIIALLLTVILCLCISMLTKGLAAQKQRSAQDNRMLELLRRDESYVSLENLSEVLRWYRAEQ